MHLVIICPNGNLGRECTRKSDTPNKGKTFLLNPHGSMAVYLLVYVSKVIRTDHPYWYVLVVRHLSLRWHLSRSMHGRKITPDNIYASDVWPYLQRQLPICWQDRCHDGARFTWTGTTTTGHYQFKSAEAERHNSVRLSMIRCKQRQRYLATASGNDHVAQ